MSKFPLVSTSVKKEAMLKSLQNHSGRVSKAAKAIQITRQTHYNWYKEDEVYRNQVDNIKYECFEELGELVLDSVIAKLNEGNPAVISRCFQLMFSKWVEQMARTNPYRPRMTTKIKYIDKPNHETN